MTAEENANEAMERTDRHQLPDAVVQCLYFLFPFMKVEATGQRKGEQ